MKYRLAKLFDNDNQLDKRWAVYYHYKHPETGKYIRFRTWISNKLLTKVERRRKGEEIIKNINTRLKRGWNPFASNEIKFKTVSEALDHVMKIKSATIHKRSVWTYNSVIKHFTTYLKKQNLHTLPVDEINVPVIQDYFDHMLINETISKRTYNNRLTPLKTLFTLMLKRDIVSLNPFESIDKLKVNDPEITAFTKKELDIIKSTLPKENYELYVVSQLIYYCFLRPAEIVRLQYKDILYEHDVIVIPGSKSKNGKSQVITIPDSFKKNLVNWDINYPQDHYIFSTNLKPGTSQVAPTRIAGQWRKYADRYGIKKGIYDFKHTGNGMAFDQGFNARDIQLQNRHSSLDETQKYLNKFRRTPSEKFKSDYNGY